MATNESKNIQDITKNKDIMKRISILDGSELNTASVNCCGILKYEIIQENAPPAATRLNTILVTAPVEAAMLYLSFTLIERKIINSKISAYNTENAAASVGLNIPE